jgi:tRNA(adenine34) deaminase
MARVRDRRGSPMTEIARRIARLFAPAADRPHADASDIDMMKRCIALSREGVVAGEFPFACVIADGDEVVAETTNRVARDRDVTCHAELLAISEAYRKVGKRRLMRCTLYSTVEPCPMCSFMIRESNISRVVFAIRSPLMGGHSRWNVLGDDVLSASMPEMFGEAPVVTAGVLQREAESVWWRMNPLVWGVIRLRGVFGGRPPAPAAGALVPDSVAEYREPR